MPPVSERLRVSVYVTSYNQLAYLRQAVASVLGQTRPADEILVVDDGSTDGSVDWLREQERAHPGLLRVLHDGTNRGVGAVRRMAVEACTGDLITYVDGDDTFLPEKLEREAALLESDPDLTGVYSDFVRTDPDGNRLDAWAGESASTLPEGDVFDAVVTRTFPGGTVFRSELVRRDTLLATDPYPPGLNLYEDYDAKLRLTRAGRFGCVREVLHTYRVTPGGLSRAVSARHFETLREIYTRHQPLLEGLEPARADRLRRSIRSQLARLAWRGVKEARDSERAGRAARVLRLAREGARLDPSALRPKHAARLVRGLLGI